MNSKMFRNNILVILFILGWNSLPAQSLSLDNLSDSLNSFEKHYVYPSVLRALLGQQDKDFNELINELEYVRILRFDSTMVLENDSVLNAITDNLREENYEELATMYENSSMNVFYTKEKEGKIAGFILYRKEKYSLLLVEVVGDIKWNKLNDLMDIDYSNFTMLVE